MEKDLLTAEERAQVEDLRKRWRGVGADTADAVKLLEVVDRLAPMPIWTPKAGELVRGFPVDDRPFGTEGSFIVAPFTHMDGERYVLRFDGSLWVKRVEPYSPPTVLRRLAIQSTQDGSWLTEGGGFTPDPFDARWYALGVAPRSRDERVVALDIAVASIKEVGDER